MISNTIGPAAAAVLSVGIALCSTAMAQQYSPYYQPQYPQPQYPAQQHQAAPYQAVPNAQYRHNPAPAAPTSWSYDPYTSGLGPCPQRALGDERCADRIAPTAGQPNYWVQCAPAYGMSSAQADAQCHQSAITRAYEYSDAQHAAIAQQIAQQAAIRPGPLDLPASAYEPVSIDYTTPSDNRRRRVTIKRLSSYSEPATRQICDSFTRIDADLDSGASRTATARRCKGPDGKWHET